MTPLSKRQKLTFKVSVFALAIVANLLGDVPSAAAAKSAPQKKAVHVSAQSAQDVGERKFQANCSRCHTAPEQFSPRITGTIVRHMRVRASLSAMDERDILQYLAP